MKEKELVEKVTYVTIAAKDRVETIKTPQASKALIQYVLSPFIHFVSNTPRLSALILYSEI